MTLVSRDRIEERRALVAPGAPLAGLCDSLMGELEPLLGRDPFIPAQKALLSREGGRCAADGAQLEFDPFSPERHRCPSCGREWEGEAHHRAWITWYQLWLAERAVHAALFHRLRGDARHAELATGILAGYADRYLDYPNRDNVLGPSRLFFSTYLESIWLLQLCFAADLLGPGHAGMVARLRERVVEPARAMIAEFDEGHSNRQVWNDAALLAAASLCGDAAAFDAALNGRSGIASLVSGGLLEDGSWYEGENYHQFALRGLWYGVTLAEARGAALAPALVSRFHRAFAIPFATALPDFTMPSRKDSQYAVSLRQWRLAELAELGHARTGDRALRAGLARCYEPGHPRRDTGRSRSTADAERNTPSGALSREDLGWRALLFASPTLPGATAQPPRSAHLPAQGYTVFRREPDVYVGFDYGQSGGGHGHPDRLNLTLYEGDTRWLDDLGTGSYVDRSLHWYRSTLAHNAPLVDGHSQPLMDGKLRAHDEREGMGWALASLDIAEGEVRLERAVIVATGYLIDELSWTTRGPAQRIELPLHLAGRCDRELTEALLDGGDGIEDGFEFTRSVRSSPLAAGEVVRIAHTDRARHVTAFVAASEGATLFQLEGPRQPATEWQRFFLLRVDGATSGRIRTVIAWSADVLPLLREADVEVACGAGERHLHRRDEAGWHVELHAAGARSSIDLSGFVAAAAPAPAQPVAEPAVLSVPRRGVLELELGEEHYRRSESGWKASGSPRAQITIGTDDKVLLVSAAVRAGDPAFPAADATNPFDNEHADTLGAGVQLYLRCAEGSGAWSLVPEDGRAVRVRAIGGAAGLVAPTGNWIQRDNDYLVVAMIPLPPSILAGEPFDMDIHINETVAGRARRRGQLVMSGARGEWVYLRGDRHDDTRWLRFRLA